MFTNAKKLPATPTAAKGKPPTKPPETLSGLAEVAALDACLKAVKGLLDLKKAALKERVTETLVENGLDRKSRPDTLHVSEGPHATGRASVTKRSTASPLSQDELAMLVEMLPDVAVERDEGGSIVAVIGFAETLESHPAMLAVNPAHAANEALLKRIDKALSGIKGIPEDFIVQTAATSKVVASETAPDAVFRLDADTANVVFPLIAGVSLGTVFKDIGAAWSIVRPMIAPTPDDAKKTLSKALKASLKA